MISPDNPFQGRTSLPSLCWWRRMGTSRRTRRTTRSWGERWRQGSATSSPLRYLQQSYYLHLWFHTISIILTLKVFSINNHLQANLTSKKFAILTLKDLSLVVDSHAASSQGLKALKASLLAKKQQLIEVSLFTFQHADMVVVRWW